MRLLAGLTFLDLSLMPTRLCNTLAPLHIAT